MALSAHDAILQKRPTWLRLGALLIVVLAVGSLPACMFTERGSVVPVIMFFGGFAAMLGLAQLSRQATRTSRGPLQVDHRGIKVGYQVIAAADLPSGVVCDVVDSRGVVLRPRGSTTTINVNETVLQPLIESLRIHFRARPRFPVFARQSDWGAVANVAALAGAVGLSTWVAAAWTSSDFAGFLGFIGSLIAAIMLYCVHGRRALTVGSDGIAVRTPIGTQRLIPYAQVESVVPFEADVHIVLKSGGVYRAGFGLNAIGGHFDRCTARASMLASVVETARAAYERAGAFGETGRKAAILARGGRDVSEWMSALRNLNETQASFRSATIPDDELWRITEDPTEREPVRVAAAIALRDRLDDGGRQRLRLVVDSCVAPRLRIALDAAVDRDDASLTRALEDLEELDNAPTALKRSSAS